MDVGSWVFVATGTVAGAFVVLDAVLDRIPPLAEKAGTAVVALKEAWAKIKGDGSG